MLLIFGRCLSFFIVFLIWGLFILMIMMVFLFFDFCVIVIVLIFVLVLESILVILVIIFGIFWWIMIKVGVFMFKEILNLFNLEIWILLLLIEMLVIESFCVFFFRSIFIEFGCLVFLFLGINKIFMLVLYVNFKELVKCLLLGFIFNRLLINVMFVLWFW